MEMTLDLEVKILLMNNQIQLHMIQLEPWYHFLDNNDRKDRESTDRDESVTFGYYKYLLDIPLVKMILQDNNNLLDKL